MKMNLKFSIRMKKIFNYFSIFTIAIGSIFGTMNAANAATLTLTQGNGTLNTAVGSGDTEIDDADFTAGDNISITTATATLTIDSTDSQLATGGFTVGAITDTGVVGSLTITIDASFADSLTDDPYTITIGSANIDGAFSMTAADDYDDDPDGLKLAVTNASSFGTTFLLSNFQYPPKHQ